MTQEVQIEKVGPFRRWGGSSRYAKKIAGMIPAHKVYVEPFAGAASVFFEKELSEKEVLADLDAELVHTLKVISKLDSDKVKKLEEKDRGVSKERLSLLEKQKPPSGALERAHRFLYISGGSWSGTGRGVTTDRDVAYSPKRLLRFKERLENANIECAEYKATIKKYNGKDTFFFLDPPYPGEWDGSAPTLNKDKQELDLEEFVKAVKSIKGGWIVVLGDTEEQKKAVKSLGGAFKIKLREVSAEGGPKYAYRYFATNIKSVKKQAEVLTSQADRAKEKGKLTLGEFFYQPKPTRPAYPQQPQTVESLLRLFDEKDWI